MVGTRSSPESAEDAQPFASQLYPNSLALHEWQRLWRDDIVSIGHPGNGLYVISDAFAENQGRDTFHVTAGYSTRIAERFQMEYARLWPQRGRIRVHWVLPLPPQLRRDQVRQIEMRIHQYCAIFARSERLRTTEFYRGAALPLLYACFESVVRHGVPGMPGPLEPPYHLDTALMREGRLQRCWVYEKPPAYRLGAVDIFKPPIKDERWLAYRREERDLGAQYRVLAPGKIAGRQGPRTRRQSWLLAR